MPSKKAHIPVEAESLTGQEQAARAFALEAARLAANTRCQDVLVLDVRGLSPIADYFVIATGTSPRQMRSVCDEIAEQGEQKGFRPLSVCGYEAESWMLADFVTVIVHLFSAEARPYYDLENLWGDAPRIKW
ncbi:MAG TPA: ribosome silencing factor [Tepidisphaeraceae bacterium]|nr:ribosome silencing factor [Tepidisphaeraceae bacterium]